MLAQAFGSPDAPAILNRSISCAFERAVRDFRSQPYRLALGQADATLFVLCWRFLLR